jgi:hypothetical protein
MMNITYHTEDCGDRDCNGECHEGEIECLNCGEVWQGEWDDLPEACPCGEPWSSAPTEKREDFHADG